MQLERVRWRLEEGRLYRDVWPVIDSPADVKPDEVPIVSEVKSLAWRFYRQGWQKSWSDPAHLPDGVELTLTMENGDTWRWVFTTPGDLPAVAAPAPATGSEAAPAAAPEAGTAPQPAPQPAPEAKP